MWVWGLQGGDFLGHSEKTEALVNLGCGPQTIPDRPQQTGGFLNREETEATGRDAGQEAFVLWRYKEPSQGGREPLSFA